MRARVRASSVCSCSRARVGVLRVCICVSARVPVRLRVRWLAGSLAGSPDRWPARLPARWLLVRWLLLYPSPCFSVFLSVTFCLLLPPSLPFTPSIPPSCLFPPLPLPPSSHPTHCLSSFTLARSLPLSFHLHLSQSISPSLPLFFPIFLSLSLSHTHTPRGIRSDAHDHGEKGRDNDRGLRARGRRRSLWRRAANIRFLWPCVRTAPHACAPPSLPPPSPCLAVSASVAAALSFSSSRPRPPTPLLPPSFPCRFNNAELLSCRYFKMLTWVLNVEAAPAQTCK